MTPDRGEDLAAELARLTAPARVSTTAPDRDSYARDLWPRGLLGLRAGRAAANQPASPTAPIAPIAPIAIVWPTSTEEVQAVVRLCGARGVPLVPFGAGSGVCGGTVPVRGGVVLDLKRMRRLAIDRQGRTVTAEAGVLGSLLERELGRRGFTLGHFPSSIMCSTLGGWLATRSAGQCSSRYGKIEDLVRSLEVVTGSGERLDTAEQGEGGPDLTQLLVGSEGTLGVITRATLAITPAPEARLLRGFQFPRLEAGCEAMRRVMQRGLRPAVLRLYDELDSAIQRTSSERPAAPSSGNARPEHGAAADSGERSLLRRALGALGLGSPEALRRRAVAAALARPERLNRLVDLGGRLGLGCRLVVGCEGPAALAEAEARAVFDELAKAGGRDLGPGPGERWLRHRYDVSFNLPKVFAAGAFADTMEVATTWERLVPLYRAVRAAVAPLAFVMAHFSHAYEDGCSIYFTFVATDEGAGTEAALARYDALWRAGLGAVTAVGATISHHHGVGLSKAPFLAAEHGEALRIQAALKRALDPLGILNPGKLAP